MDILRIIMKHMNGGDTYVKSSITNGHFIHASPLKRTGVSIYLKSSRVDETWMELVQRVLERRGKEGNQLNMMTNGRGYFALGRA